MMPLGSGARFDAKRTRRRLLWRCWDNKRPMCNFICLNPSTADEKKNDQSVTKMIGFSERLGAGSLVVTNLWDFMSTDPDILYTMNPDELNSLVNNRTILEFANQSTWIMLAWGVHGRLYNRDQTVLNMLEARDLKRRCLVLRMNFNGTPAHPLMMPYSLKPQKFNWKERAI